MSDSNPEKTKWSKKKKLIVIVVLIMLVIGLVVFVPLFEEMPKVEKVFSAFNRALIARNYQQAYDLATPTTKASVTYEAFVTEQNSLAARVGPLRSFESTDTEVRSEGGGYIATIHARLVFEKGELPFLVVLKTVNGRWMIYKSHELESVGDGPEL